MLRTGLKRCTKCIMPETKPGIWFNESGVCNACVNEESKKNIDWDARFKELQKIGDEVKKKKPSGHNCVIAVSGGKDSTFLSVIAKEKLGLTPLLVCAEPAYVTDRGRKNLNNLSKLGFDIFVFKSNQKIIPALLKRSFYEDGQPVRAFEFVLYSVPMRIAMNYGSPLVIWGENPQFEYGNEGEGQGASATQQKTCCALNNQDADYWAAGSITSQDLISFQHPTADDLKKAGIRAIYMSYYIKFDSRKMAEFAIERGLTIRPKNELLGTGGYWDFEQLDDEIPIISHLVKYLKYGYGRATDQASRDIRWGHIRREEGLRLAKEYDGHCNPDYIKRYCDYIGITVPEFWRVADSFRNPNIWTKENKKWELQLEYVAH